MVVIPFQRILARQPLHLGTPADHRAAVRVVIEQRGVAFLGKQGSGIAVHALRPFLQNHLPFGLPVILADAQVGHPVGLHLHHQRQAVRGDALEIGGVVIAGEGVVHAAIGGHGLGQLARLQFFGALEHQVFQVMRDPRLAGRLVRRSDPVPNHLDHHRGAVILDHDGFKAVGQGEMGDAVVFGGRRFGKRGQGADSQGQQGGQGRSKHGGGTSLVRAKSDQ